MATDDYPTCPTCDGIGNDPTARYENCKTCGGPGCIMTRDQFAVEILSAQFPEHTTVGPWTLPLVPLDATDTPTWLADAITHADMTCEQLLQLFDSITVFADSYEAGAPYWRVAAERCITLIVTQLQDALPVAREGASIYAQPQSD